jgi:hypothetical protein
VDRSVPKIPQACPVDRSVPKIPQACPVDRSVPNYTAIFHAMHLGQSLGGTPDCSLPMKGCRRESSGPGPFAYADDRLRWEAAARSPVAAGIKLDGQGTF